MTTENPGISKEAIIKLTDEQTYNSVIDLLRILVGRRNMESPNGDQFEFAQANPDEKDISLADFEITIEQSLPEALVKTFGFEALIAFVKSEDSAD